MIGPLLETERRNRIRRFLAKKRKLIQKEKYQYECRKTVADKRLRIKGRFVKPEQAFKILGLSQADLLDNQTIQELLTQYYEEAIQLNSTFQNSMGQGIKVRNFQALIDVNYNHNTKPITSQTETHNDMTGAMSDETAQKELRRLELHINNPEKNRLQVLQNFIQPIFRVEKVART